MTEKMQVIGTQKKKQYVYYIIFGLTCVILLMTYLSSTIIHHTTDRQFPVNSLAKYPLSILIFPAELFSIAFALYFIYTLFNNKPEKKPDSIFPRSKTRIAVLIPIYHEPAEIVERTINAVRNIRWKGGVRIYLLDDSTQKEFIDANNQIAATYGLATPEQAKDKQGMIIRRSGREGYKAGNINNAVKQYVTEDYFIIFDADQAPVPEFLDKTMDFFTHSDVAFVQSPQYYENDATPLERSTKIGNNIFFQAQLVSKSKDGALPFCGTNVVVRTAAFKEVHGFSYFTATEDIDLGIRLNAQGYRGAYVPMVLAYGYGPQDFKSYSSQQYRWANGNLAVLRENWAKILFSKNFSLRYQIHTFFTLAWWFIGVVAFLFIATPIISLLTGWPTHHTWLPEAFIGLIFLNLILGVGMIKVSLQHRINDDTVTIRDAFLQYSLITNSMFIFMRAAFNAAIKRYIGFVTTSKTKSTTGLGAIKWNLLFSVVCFGLSVFALYHTFLVADWQNIRTYLPISLWLLFYSLLFASSLLFVEPSPSSQPVYTAYATRSSN